jgi:hypothetical protein
MTSSVHCRVRIWSTDHQLTRILTGLVMLERQGRLRFTQEVLPIPPLDASAAAHLRDVRRSHMELILNDHIKVFVDVHDSWEIDAEAVRTSTLYFKRSFTAAAVAPEYVTRVRPLGLNYDVRADGLDWHEAYRTVLLHRGPKQRTRALLDFIARVGLAYIGRGPRATVKMLTAQPEPTLEPRVLFMAAAWDPMEIADHTADRVRQRHEVNEMRAQCVRALRSAFGKRFFGGLMHSAFAAKEYPDVLLSDPSLASRRRYIELVRAYPICVATAGLHGSNGMKLAEYVALSRAIVSEPLCYQVRGDFLPNGNYLEFRSADECVQQVTLLMEDAALRGAMMERNWQYYEAWLRPDRFVGQLIAEAMPGQEMMDGQPSA